MYRFYIKQEGKQVLLPVTPSEVQTKIGNLNQTVNVLNFGQVNVIKEMGLDEISFTVLLPNECWSFVQVEGGFKEPSYFLEAFRGFKESKKPMSLIIFRRLADGSQLFCGNMEVVLEEYTILEKGGQQGDFWVDMRWKEYRSAKSIVYSVVEDGDKTVLVSSGQVRETKEVNKTYTVKKGDTLWGIAKSQLGNGSLFATIASKNNIADPNKIYPGQVLVLG